MATYVQDSSGNWYTLSVDSSGNLITTPTTAPGSSTVNTQNCTVTLNQVIQWASTHVELMPITSVGGYTNEPAISLANDVIQELLAQPLAWKFNRNTANLFVTQFGRQESQFAGATAWTSQYGVGIGLAANNAITESGNTVTVGTLDAHNFNVGDTVYMTGNTVSAYNSTLTQTPTSTTWSGGWVITAVPSPTSFQFTHASSGLASSGAPGIYDFGWLEEVSMLDMNDTSPTPYVWEVEAGKMLRKTSQSGRPRKVAVTLTGGGIITLRFDVVPNSNVWGMTLTYQVKAPLKQALTDLWSPFPDEYGFVYRQAFLARCYRYLNHPRADAEEARSLAMIEKAMSANDREESEQYVSPENPVMGGEFGYGW